MNLEQQQDYLCLPVVIVEDDLLHTDETPFCDDVPHCPCHTDVARFWRYCQQPYDCGLITLAEQARIFRGEQLIPAEAHEQTEPGWFWNGRQALRENGWPPLGLGEREG